jgi:predicted ATP-grasp superfamily ATP-dependent carboligase
MLTQATSKLYKKTNEMNILVTDGENRSALAVTRSLGRLGCNVFVAGRDRGNISARSKFCRKTFETPEAIFHGGIYLHTINEIVKSENISVIFPMTEQSINCLNRAREQFANGVILACVRSETMDAVSNKYKLFQLAERLGVDIPKTIFISGVEDYFRKSPLITNFPVVVKPAFSTIEIGEKIISGRVMYASCHTDLNRLYKTDPALRNPSMIQEMIVGEGTGLFTLFDRNKHLALFSHRRLLEKPPTGGVSVLSQSVPLDESMVKAADKLLSAVGWSGIAMVEFKRDIRDGKAKLMEINGRFWGSLQLAISSGVDFPALCLEYYLGKKPSSLICDYKIGHRLKWLFGILDHMIIRMNKSNRVQNIPPGTLTPVKIVAELLKPSWGNASFDVYDSEDRGPFYSETGSYIKNILGFTK